MFETINNAEQTIEDQFKNHVYSTLQDIQKDESILMQNIETNEKNIQDSNDFINTHTEINPLYKKKIEAFIERLSDACRAAQIQLKELQKQKSTYTSIQDSLEMISQDKKQLDTHTKKILDIIRSHNTQYNNIQNIK